MCWWYARGKDTACMSPLHCLELISCAMASSFVVGGDKRGLVLSCSEAVTSCSDKQSQPCSCLDVHAEDGPILGYREGGRII